MKINKHLKTLKRRETLKLNHHIESLGAAFCRETGLLPSETSLVVATDDKGTHYYFTEKPAALDLDNLHPHMRELVELTSALTNALDANDADGVASCQQALRAFVVGMRGQ